MRFLRFVGRVLWGILTFFVGILKALAHEILPLAQFLLVFLPMSIFLLMLFMFFQVSIDMEQVDFFTSNLGSFSLGVATCYVVNRAVVKFWKKP